MTALTALRRFLREFDTMLDHARTGRDPHAGRHGTASVTTGTVDGWYNFQARSTDRVYRR
jgi:plasmid stabilization system protein ParE